jgi:CheY-like chemotaxis protein/nitrogen-specific signal transduction histidine kinase
VVSRPTDAGGRIAILLDATDLLARERELEEARCAAEQASRAKTEFLAAMSHEVRTPLQSVLGYAELLLRGRQDPLAAAQRTMVERMLRAGVLVQRVVDDALDLARIEARVVALDLQEVDLPALLAQVHEVLALAASEQGVALHVPVGAQPPVHADSLRLAQILLNLGSNAIKYNRRGGWVHFGVGEDGDRVRVTVSDSGLGVPPAERGQLFRAFHRAGREGGSVPGSGIGLAISERLAREMGGELGYAPHPGGGSAFWVTLPRGAGEVPGRSSQVQVRAQARAALGARILYVSDDPASIALVASALAPLGATLLSAASVAHGLELARVERPDLLLLELGVDGLAALVALRSDPATAHLPAIALSAMASVSEVSSALVAGFASFVPKPVTPSTLETGLRSALAPRLARTA